jgi:hypothetical protein
MDLRFYGMRLCCYMFDLVGGLDRGKRYSSLDGVICIKAGVYSSYTLWSGVCTAYSLESMNSIGWMG